MRSLVLLLLTSFVFGCLASSSAISSDLTNLSIRRSIDLRGHVEEIVNHIDVKNNGKTAISEYIIAIPANRAKHLAFIEGTSRDNTVHYPTTLTTVTSSSAPHPSGTVFYRITLDSPIQPDGEKKLNIVASYTQTLVPYPATITQNENQLVLYENNAIVYTPYTTKTQSTVIKLASSHLESWTKKNGKHAGDQLEYGPFNDIPPFDTSRPITVHFQNNAPFATATKLRKIIEISHFGNIAVEEHYQLRHSGATLKGHFSRHDYQSRPGQAPASFRQITAILPATATDLYYRDRIGNVSTSHVRESDDGTIVMEVQPRYPMMGGWKTDFYMGYNVPAHEFLSYSADSRSTYILNITFGTPFPQLNVDEQQIRIILPEGASNIQWSTPFDIDSEETDVHYTYLDTTGRPVLVLNKHNVVRLHNQYFQVSYTYTPTAMIRKPLLLVFAFFLFFLASMAYARFELTIAPKKQQIVTSKRSGRIGTLINTVVVSSQQLLAAYESKNNDRIVAAESVRNEVTTALNDLVTSDVGEIAKKLDGALTKAKNEAKAYVKAESATLSEEARQQSEKLATTIEQCEALLSQLVSK